MPDRELERKGTENRIEGTLDEAEGRIREGWAN